jgi:tetratricopeptide (TPR) repeat protein
VRLLLCGLLLTAVAAIGARTWQNFRIGRERLTAQADFRAERYHRAAQRLSSILARRPRDERIHAALGEARLALAAQENDLDAAQALLRSARGDFLAAASLCPPCVEAAYGLAKSEARLAFLHDGEPPDPPLDPIARFRRLLELRPHGITYRYLFIEYLHVAGRTDLLREQIRRLAYAYPPEVRSLEREPFWNAALEEAAQAGVREALADDILPRESHQLLSQFHARDGDWERSLDHHQAAMAIQSFRNGERDFLRLGELQLRTGKGKVARTAFDRALSISPDREATLRRVYAAHQNTDRLLDFADYARSLNRFFVYSQAPALIRAKALAEAGRKAEARNLLTRLGEEERSAEAYVRLAEMARADQNWDAMELAAHRATVLEPRHVPYRLLLAESLQRQGKLDRVESELSLAIQYQEPPSDQLFHRRALLRWRRKDFAAALADWRAAVRIRPDHAGYQRHLERAAEQLERQAETTASEADPEASAARHLDDFERFAEYLVDYLNRRQEG